MEQCHWSHSPVTSAPLLGLLYLIASQYTCLFFGHSLDVKCPKSCNKNIWAVFSSPQFSDSTLYCLSSRPRIELGLYWFNAACTSQLGWTSQQSPSMVDIELMTQMTQHHWGYFKSRIKTNISLLLSRQLWYCPQCGGTCRLWMQHLTFWVWPCQHSAWVASYQDRCLATGLTEQGPPRRSSCLPTFLR